MSGKYQAYTEYRDSGFEWLGDIPSHWGSAELKRYSFVQGGYAFSSDSFIDSGKAVIRIGDIKQDGSISLESCKYIQSDGAEQYSQYEVQSGDLLMAMTGATIGKAGWFKEVKPALLNQRVGSFKCNTSYLNYRFFWYILNSFGYQEYIKLTAFGGAQPNISDSGMVGYKSAYPSIAEQQKIANFLDHETAKIDTLIAKQQQLIKLLKEKRQAVISHAVTKGLNPNAPMRDSGIEWLGEVPAHWTLKRFKYIFKIRKRISGELGYDVLSITQKGIKVKDIESGEGQLSMDYSKYQFVYKGDYAMNHMDLLTGFVDISKYDGVTSPDYRVFTLEEENAVPAYFLAFLQMGYINKLFFPFGQGAAHIGRWRLPTEAFNDFLAPCPPEHEQKAIAEFITKSLEKMARLEEKAIRAIKLMQERRTALISAAVTGKNRRKKLASTTPLNNIETIKKATYESPRK